MTHKIGKRTGWALALLALGAGAAMTGGLSVGTAEAQMMKPSMNDVNGMMANWPMAAKKAAKKVISKYGAPDEATPSMLVWHNRGGWKRTVASRTPTMHHFPGPHPDSVEQVIDYRVPLGKYDDLARYDGSVNIDRTRGEMSARCDLEEMNLLALNLAHDIITGRKSVEQARGFYARVVKMFKTQKKVHPYQMRLMFMMPRGMTQDPDKIAPVMRPLVRKMRMQQMKMAG